MSTPTQLEPYGIAKVRGCLRMVGPGEIGEPQLITTDRPCRVCGRPSYKGRAPGLVIEHCHSCGALKVDERRRGFA